MTVGEKELRKNMSILPVSTVSKLTGLTPRQLRYYERFELVYPKRSAGNQRLYSLNDIERLLEIKDYLDSGMTMQEIRRVLSKTNSPQISNDPDSLSDTEARKIFHKEMLRVGRWENHGSNNLW